MVFSMKNKVLVLVYEKKMENPTVRDIHELSCNFMNIYILSMN